MDPELKNNLSKKQTWIRGLYMVLFAVIFSITEVVIGAVVVLQFLFTLITGQTNPRLLQFGQSLSLYVYQVMRFQTFNQEELPFPFSEWPSPDARDESIQ
jgi:hypothetical protein